jgi:hypothetical protein
MTLEEIIAALKSTNAVPTAALAGLALADGIPVICSAGNGSGPDWESREQAQPRREPPRSAKIGGSEPCACGSGKKFKTSCGSGTAAVGALIGHGPAQGAIDG